MNVIVCWYDGRIIITLERFRSVTDTDTHTDTVTILVSVHVWRSFCFAYSDGYSQVLAQLCKACTAPKHSGPFSSFSWALLTNSKLHPWMIPLMITWWKTSDLKMKIRCKIFQNSIRFCTYANGRRYPLPTSMHTCVQRFDVTRSAKGDDVSWRIRSRNSIRDNAKPL